MICRHLNICDYYKHHKLPLLEKEDIESFVEFFDKTSSDIAFISAEADNPQGLGRVLKENDEFVKIVEESDATE